MTIDARKKNRCGVDDTLLVPEIINCLPGLEGWPVVSGGLTESVGG